MQPRGIVDLSEVLRSLDEVTRFAKGESADDCRRKDDLQEVTDRTGDKSSR